MQRLIFDARRANMHFVPSLSVMLPTSADISNLALPSDQVVYGAKSDLDNFYHRIVLPEWMVDYFGLPHVRASDISPELAEEFGSDAKIFPAFLRLPMGFSHAVPISNSMHVNFLSNTILRHHTLLRPDQRYVLRPGQIIFCLIIDDVFMFSTDKSQLEHVVDTLLSEYEGGGFVVKLSKLVRPTTKMRVIGLDWDGESKSLSASPETQMQIRNTCLAMVRAGTVSGKAMQILLGHYIWSALVRRPLLSILSNVYRFIKHCIRERDLFAPRVLWDSVKQELLQMAYLTPLMFAHLTDSVYDHVLFTDASTTGAAVVSTKFPSSFRNYFEVFLGHQKQYDIQHDTSACFKHCFNKPSLMSTKFAFPWKYDLSHINVLEMKTLEMAVHWLARHPIKPGTRAVIFSDSMVCVCALAKGRSSSPYLAKPLKRLSSILLSVGLKLIVPHLRSELNPADEPSRRFQNQRC